MEMRLTKMEIYSELRQKKPEKRSRRVFQLLNISKKRKVILENEILIITKMQMKKNPSRKMMKLNAKLIVNSGNGPKLSFCNLMISKIVMMNIWLERSKKKEVRSELLLQEKMETKTTTIIIMTICQLLLNSAEKSKPIKRCQILKRRKNLMNWTRRKSEHEEI